MKNAIWKVGITFAIVIVAIALGLMYSSANQESDKTTIIEQEIMFMDSKITSLVNYLNNIELQNYQVSISKIEEEETETSGKEQEKTQDKKEDNSEENSQSNSQETSMSKMKEALIVKDGGEINWDKIQGEAEIFYSSWATIVLNLYDIDVSSDKIIEYSNCQDKAIVGIKNKDKTETIKNLAQAHSLLYNFMEKTNIDDMKKQAIRAKGYIINAYANVQDDNWEEVRMQVMNAEGIFGTLVNDAEKATGVQKFNINKAYILIGELKNSLDLKDKEIFYIKYKNVLEELNIFI